MPAIIAAVVETVVEASGGFTGTDCEAWASARADKKPLSLLVEIRPLDSIRGMPLPNLGSRSEGTFPSLKRVCAASLGQGRNIYTRNAARARSDRVRASLTIKSRVPVPVLVTSRRTHLDPAISIWTSVFRMQINSSVLRNRS